MKSPIIGMVALTVLAAPCAAETRYDTKLEKAVMAIVAKKIGDIRSGFSYDAKPEIVGSPATSEAKKPDDTKAEADAGARPGSIIAF